MKKNRVRLQRFEDLIRIFYGPNIMSFKAI